MFFDLMDFLGKMSVLVFFMLRLFDLAILPFNSGLSIMLSEIVDVLGKTCCIIE